MRSTRETTTTKHHGQSHRVRDFFLYIAIGILVTALAGAVGVYQAKIGGGKPVFFLKWVGFTILTLLIFFWAIRRNRPFWRNARFWKLLSLFAGMHIIIGIGLLTRLTITSLIPFMIVTPLENSLLRSYLSRVGFPQELHL
jgi:drug/metabolite transporter (DMT)-like permease